MRLLKCTGEAGLDGRVSADKIERECGVPIPRAGVLLELFKLWQFVDYNGSARSSDSLPFGWANILPGGSRVIPGLRPSAYLTSVPTQLGVLNINVKMLGLETHQED